jgi:intracellular sulfur oxidation DsrE/DsrF family protein
MPIYPPALLTYTPNQNLLAMKKLSFVALVFSLLVFWACQPDSSSGSTVETPKNRLLYEFVAPDSANQARMFKQIDNVLAEVPDMEIEVVVHGPAIFLLKNGTQFHEEIKARKQRGVTFTACRNSIIGRGMTEVDMIPEATIVPSAFVQIVQRQNEGWPYIKSDN